MIDVIVAILLLILSYLLGSIPFGLIIGKTTGKDLRESGSGNIGSTNAIRILGLKLGLLSAACDIIKGMFVIILIYILEANGVWYNPLVINGDSLYVLYGLAAVLGHCFPIYIKFKGGKAVATSLGVLFVTVPLSAVVALVVFLITMLITGIVSISSTTATISAWISAFILYGFILNDIIYSCLFLIILVALIAIRHIPNYKRLINGTEHSFKKKKEA